MDMILKNRTAFKPAARPLTITAPRIRPRRRLMHAAGAFGGRPMIAFILNEIFGKY
ncbi:MAG: hypothetical protein ACQKBV_06385 [Puniceicoccales bacterium]